MEQSRLGKLWSRNFTTFFLLILSEDGTLLLLEILTTFVISQGVAEATPVPRMELKSTISVTLGQKRSWKALHLTELLTKVMFLTMISVMNITLLKSIYKDDPRLNFRRQVDAMQIVLLLQSYFYILFLNGDIQFKWFYYVPRLILDFPGSINLIF